MKDSLTIAVFHNLPSGGAKRSLFEWLKRLSQKHTLDLYSYAQTSEDYLDIRPFVRRRYIYGVGLPASTNYNLIQKVKLLYGLIPSTKEMARDIDSRNYDLVFVIHCTYVQSPLLLQYLKTPSLYYCQEPFRRVYEPRSWNTGSFGSICREVVLRVTDMGLKKIDFRSAQSADMVLVNSNYSRGMIRKAYQIDAHTCYLGVDIKIFESKPEIKKEYEVISVGRLEAIKGHDFIINSLGLLDETIRPRLKIICDSSNEAYKREIQALARKCKVTCLFQQVPGDEMPEIYNRATLTVYAPIREPLGLVTLESMACGVPAVAVGEGGINETVKHNETGLLTERCPQKFAQAMQELLIDPVKREAMGKAGISYVKENWNWETSTQRIEKKFYELISSIGVTRKFGPPLF
jgi:glycosyltransferase involved in cell wall biosynthesis